MNDSYYGLDEQYDNESPLGSARSCDDRQSSLGSAQPDGDSHERSFNSSGAMDYEDMARYSEVQFNSFTKSYSRSGSRLTQILSAYNTDSPVGSGIPYGDRSSQMSASDYRQRQVSLSSNYNDLDQSGPSSHEDDDRSYPGDASSLRSRFPSSQSFLSDQTRAGINELSDDEDDAHDVFKLAQELRQVLNPIIPMDVEFKHVLQYLLKFIPVGYQPIIYDFYRKCEDPQKLQKMLDIPIKCYNGLAVVLNVFLNLFRVFSDSATIFAVKMPFVILFMDRIISAVLQDREQVAKFKDLMKFNSMLNSKISTEYKSDQYSGYENQGSNSQSYGDTQSYGGPSSGDKTQTSYGDQPSDY